MGPHVHVPLERAALKSHEPLKPYYSTASSKCAATLIPERHSLLLQREHVDLKKAAEVELWTDVLGIYTADLLDAVAVMGTRSSEVLQYIVDKGLVGRALRSPKTKPKSSGEGR